MNYRVYWDPHSASQLQRIYDSALDKKGVANTVTRIGLELAANPVGAGESRDPLERILVKPPLVVWFRINERMREVTIFDVRPSRRQDHQ